MTPAIIAQAFKDAGVTTTKDIIRDLCKAMSRVETRIEAAYKSMPTAQAHEATKRDRQLLKVQVSYLDHLEGRHEPDESRGPR